MGFLMGFQVDPSRGTIGAKGVPISASIGTVGAKGVPITGREHPHLHTLIWASIYLCTPHPLTNNDKFSPISTRKCGEDKV